MLLINMECRCGFMMIVRNGLCFCSAKLDSGAVMVHGMIMVFVHDAGFLGLFIMNVMWQSFCDCCEQCGILCVFMGL